MNFKELQEKVFQNSLRYGERYGVVIDQDFALLKFYEEAGEYMQAVLIHRKKCRPEKYLPEEESKKELEKELADVLGMVIVNARLFNIDLEEALKHKNWLYD